MKRVVITGMGCVSPYGVGTAILRNGILAGQSAIGAVPWLADEPVFRRNGGAYVDYSPDQHFMPEHQMLYDRATQFALIACAEAWQQAALDDCIKDRKRVAVYIGTAVGGSDTLDGVYREMYRERSPVLPPLTVPRAMANAAASHISLKYRLQGPLLTIAAACASSTQAVGEAMRLLQYGRADLAIAGGTDACLNPLVWRAWEALRAMAPDTCRPFSGGRKGMVLGEGAGIIVLETLESATARGAPIFAEVIGYAANSDAIDIVKPSVGGAGRAISEALADAQLPASAVDYVNAHGTGTLLNDRIETAAIRQALGQQAERVVVTSVKSGMGHLMGAAGIVELIAGLSAFSEKMVPPTLNYLEPDPECDLDYAPNAARPGHYGIMLKNSLAFGGLNVSLVLRNYQEGA